MASSARPVGWAAAYRYTGTAMVGNKSTLHVASIVTHDFEIRPDETDSISTFRHNFKIQRS